MLTTDTNSTNNIRNHYTSNTKYDKTIRESYHLSTQKSSNCDTTTILSIIVCKWGPCHVKGHVTQQDLESPTTQKVGAPT